MALQVDCDVGAPQVNYRESISQLADIKYTHKKQSGGSGQFAEVAIRFEPGEPGTGFEFRSEIKGGTVPKEYIPGVTKVGALSCHDTATHIPACTPCSLLGRNSTVAHRTSDTDTSESHSLDTDYITIMHTLPAARCKVLRGGGLLCPAVSQHRALRIGTPSLTV